jgi:tRNA threonylcarbamoyladenosine biosynthesis protein TsaE
MRVRIYRQDDALPIIRESELDLISYSAEQTRALGVRLGALLRKGDVICLTGDMGAGKTVFTSGLGIGWGATTPITSPTFNLVHQHRRQSDRSVLYHLDCYRLRGVQDVDSIGLDDILDGQGVVVLEWAERIKEGLPKEHLWVEFRVREENRRNLLMEAVGARYQALLDDFRASLTRT